MVSPTTSTAMPITQKGMTLARMKSDFLTGLTFICSIVPISFSRTMLKADKEMPMVVSWSNTLLGRVVSVYRNNKVKKGVAFSCTFWSETLNLALKRGYRVILYPSKAENTYTGDIKIKLKKYLKNGLIEDVLDENSISSFEKAIIDYDVNIVNSIFVTDESATFHWLLNKYSLNNNETWNLGRDVQLGFTVLNLGKKIYPSNTDDAKRIEFNLTLDKDYFTQWLCKKFKPARFLYSGRVLSFFNDLVVYIGDKDDEAIRNYIEANYQSISDKIAEKKLSFFYFPFIKKNPHQFSEKIVPVFDYLLPFSKNKSTELIEELLEIISPEQFYELINKDLGFTEVKRPMLIRNLGNHSYPSQNLFSVFSFNSGNSIETQLSGYIESLIPAIELDVAYKKRSVKDENYNAEDNFAWDGNKIAEEIKEKIRILTEAGQDKALAELVLHIFSNMNGLRPALLEKIKALGVNNEKPKLSPLSSFLFHKIRDMVFGKGKNYTLCTYV